MDNLRRIVTRYCYLTHLHSFRFVWVRVWYWYHDKRDWNSIFDWTFHWEILCCSCCTIDCNSIHKQALGRIYINLVAVGDMDTVCVCVCFWVQHCTMNALSGIISIELTRYELDYMLKRLHFRKNIQENVIILKQVIWFSHFVNWISERDIGLYFDQVMFGFSCCYMIIITW